MTTPLFHIVLHQPQIPNNTGNIGRTCVATGCSLHLIRPLAFDTSEKACRRAGLDYWARLAPVEHETLDACLASLVGSEPERSGRLWVFTTRTGRVVHDVELNAGDVLLFGGETSGLPAELVARYTERSVRLPMAPGERSLNLATAVCAAVYLGIDQLLRRGRLRTGPGATLLGPGDGGSAA
ncbi:MAG TPA: tRNA (cytidine(34)-2'-O)-methyltransferase [Phycisphaerales bacterium]|nr:tRNA (cytidine(34)-2'-O)-methyltransferase [Phycisphaerales bacterium]